jgi:hypothetical protein
MIFHHGPFVVSKRKHVREEVYGLKGHIKKIYETVPLKVNVFVTVKRGSRIAITLNILLRGVMRSLKS